jgi:hypothetical protein
MYTGSAVFRLNAVWEPDSPAAVAFRRNTVTSLRKPDACRTLAARVVSAPRRKDSTYEIPGYRGRRYVLTHRPADGRK